MRMYGERSGSGAADETAELAIDGAPAGACIRKLDVKEPRAHGDHSIL
jgi:hypothetical protein